MKATLRIAIGALTLFFIASCSQSPVGIFESIEREREILDDRNLGNELTIGAMALADERYFLAAGSIYHRGRVDTDYIANDREQWTRLQPPGSAADNNTSTSLVPFDPVGATPLRIYAVYSNQEGTESGVYEIDPASPSVPSSPVFGSESPGVESVLGVFVVSDGLDYLLVVVRTGLCAYAVYWTTDAVTFTAVTGAEGNQPVIAAASDGTTVALLTPTAIAVDDDITDATPPDTGNSPGLDAGDLFGGLYYQSSVGRWWMGDNAGHLFSSEDLVTWTTNDTAYEISAANDDPVPFTAFVEVFDMVENVLLVGTDGFGYRVLGTDANVTPRDPDEDGSNYEASDLADTAIRCWYTDPDEQDSYPVPTEPGADPYTLHDGYLVFAGTAATGLWRALAYDGPIQWVRE
jgi:hypothetical protein